MQVPVILRMVTCERIKIVSYLSAWYATSISLNPNTAI